MSLQDEMLDFLGIDPKTVDSIEKFKEKFSGEGAAFIPASELTDTKSETFKRFVPKVVGQIAGKSTAVVKKRLSEMEIDLSPDEIKDKPFEDILDIALGKTVNTYKQKISDYETKLQHTNDERVVDLTTKLEQYKQKATDYETANRSLKEAYEQETTAHKNELKSFKLTTRKNDIFGKHIKFGSTVKDLEKEGYFSKIEKNYKFELSEDENDIEVFSKETGARIPNPKKAGAFMSVPEILEAEGLKEGVWSINEGAKKNNQKINTIFTTSNANNGGDQNNAPSRKVHSRITG